MSARAIALLLLGASSASCGSAPGEPMVITDVIANIDALNGQTIRVVGYLGECGGFECPLFRNPAEKAQVDEDRRISMAALRAAVRERRGLAPPEFDDLPWLGIGSGEHGEFDRQAAPYTNGYVVITGRVTNMCRIDGQPGCTDRNTDLQPTHIARWSPDAGGENGGNLTQ